MIPTVKTQREGGDWVKNMDNTLWRFFPHAWYIMSEGLKLIQDTSEKSSHIN